MLNSILNDAQVGTKTREQNQPGTPECTSQGTEQRRYIKGQLQPLLVIRRHVNRKQHHFSEPGKRAYEGLIEVEAEAAWRHELGAMLRTIDLTPKDLFNRTDKIGNDYNQITNDFSIYQDEYEYDKCITQHEIPHLRFNVRLRSTNRMKQSRKQSQNPQESLNWNRVL